MLLKQPLWPVDALGYCSFCEKDLMNGRCETDPFDQARNVCGLCYGEFCLSCLVNVKGRKHPLCKECAIIASGIRAGAKPTMRGPKRTAPARRKALLEAPVQDSFQFFDSGAGGDLAAIEQTIAEAEKPAPKTKRGKPAKKAAAKKASAKKKQRTTAPKTKKAPKKATAKKTRSSKKDPSHDQAGDAASTPVSPAVDPDATISSSDRLSEAVSPPPAEPAAPQAAPAAAAEQQVPSTEDAATTGSAVDQLDSIREQALDQSVEPQEQERAFRKPRPFIKPASKSGTDTGAVVESEIAPGPAAHNTAAAAATSAGTASTAGTAQAPSPVQEPAPTQQLPVQRPTEEPVAEKTTEPAAPSVAESSSATAPTPAATPADPHAAAEKAREGSPKPLARRRSTAKAAAPEPTAAEPTTSEPATSRSATSGSTAPTPAAAESKEPAPAATTAEGTDASITSELSSPFNVAPPPPLPRRRAKPEAGQDPYERSNPDERLESEPDARSGRRRSDRDVATANTDTTAPDSAAADQEPQNQPTLPKRRRAVDSPVGGRRGAAPAATNASVDEATASDAEPIDPDEAPAIRPPAWTQRPHDRRASDYARASKSTATSAESQIESKTPSPTPSPTGSDADITNELPVDDDQPLVAAAPKPLPKRRRSSN